jgi:phytoene dehydrogenase-like protein
MIYIGLPFCIKDYGFEAPSTFFNSTMNPSESYKMVLQDSTFFDRKDTFFMITNYSEVDDSMAPDGHNSIVILEIESNKRNWFNLSPEEYKKQKEIIQNAILDKVEAITKMPLREKAEVLFSATPKTLKHYSSAPNGVMCGIATSIDQSFGKRTQPTTPIENLFLTGAFTSPPSVAGSLDSGISSSNLVLKVF